MIETKVTAVIIVAILEYD